MISYTYLYDSCWGTLLHQRHTIYLLLQTYLFHEVFCVFIEWVTRILFTSQFAKSSVYFKNEIKISNQSAGLLYKHILGQPKACGWPVDNNLTPHPFLITGYHNWKTFTLYLDFVFPIFMIRWKNKLLFFRPALLCMIEASILFKWHLSHIHAHVINCIDLFTKNLFLLFVELTTLNVKVPTTFFNRFSPCLSHSSYCFFLNDSIAIKNPMAVANSDMVTIANMAAPESSVEFESQNGGTRIE